MLSAVTVLSGVSNQEKKNLFSDLYKFEGDKVSVYSLSLKGIIRAGTLKRGSLCFGKKNKKKWNYVFPSLPEFVAGTVSFFALYITHFMLHLMEIHITVIILDF